MKQEKPARAAKPRKLPKADLAALASGVHAALALAHVSGEPLPKSLAQQFYAVLAAELEAVSLPPEKTPEPSAE